MAGIDAASIPVYINCRDRVSCLARLVDWLERAGTQRIILIDNASTWEPLLEYYGRTPHHVVRLATNYGSRALWLAGLNPPGWFVYTDPDVLPLDECPLDAVGQLRESLRYHPQYAKAGLGLYIDDVPATLPSLEWERELVSKHLTHTVWTPPFGVYDSLIDTTFALHRPGTGFIYPAIRLGWPYQVRHESWYRDDAPDAELSPEDRHYLARALAGPAGSSWADARRH